MNNIANCFSCRAPKRCLFATSLRFIASTCTCSCKVESTARVFIDNSSRVDIVLFSSGVRSFVDVVVNLRRSANICRVTWTSVCYVVTSTLWIVGSEKVCHSVRLLDVYMPASHLSEHVATWQSRSSRNIAKYVGFVIDSCRKNVFRLTLFDVMHTLEAAQNLHNWQTAVIFRAVVSPQGCR